ncbi:MAG: CHASE2 domain-containing protein [Chthoniobacteraceae bacterium]
MFKPALPSLLFALLLGLLVWRESGEPWLHPAQREFDEWLSANSNPKAVSAPLTLVEINDATLGDNHPWPWAPLDFALSLSTLQPLKPAVTAIEPVLTFSKQLSPDDAQYLQLLHDKILALPKVVLAEKPGFPSDPDVVPPVESVPMLRSVQGSIDSIPEYPVIAEKPAEDLRLSAAIGLTDPAPAQAVETLPLLYRYHGEVVPSFALQAIILWSASTLDEVKVQTGVSIEVGDKLHIPIDDAGNVQPNPHVTFARMGNDDLMLAVNQLQNGQPSAVKAGAWDSQIALLGRTDAAARTITMASRNKVSPAELNATAIATMMSGVYLRTLPLAVEIALFVVIAWFAACLTHWPRSQGVVWTVSGFLLYLVIALTVYEATLITLPFITPLVLFALALANSLLRFKRKPRKGRRQRRVRHESYY